MTVQARKNILFGLVGVGVAVLWLLRVIGVFPAYIDDLILRSAPVVLVIVGLSILLRERVPFSGVVTLLISAGLLGGIGWTAFNVRQDQLRDENVIAITQEIDDEIILLRVRLQSLSTDVEITRAPSGQERTIQITFAGSTERELVESFIQDDETSATLTVNEIRKSPVPMLEAVGRGTMLVELPAGVPVDVQLEAVEGEVRLNMADVSLERLNLSQESGEALISLPNYKPLFSRSEDTLGTLALNSGRMTIRVPEDVAARFDMSRSTGGDPVYDPGVYNLLFGRDILEARLIDSAEIIQRYDVVVSRNNLVVDVVEPED